MSHSVTIMRTTTTTSGSAMYINTGYLGTFPGLLKLAQLLLGAACVGVVAYYLVPGYTRYNGQKPELFYLLVSVAFLIGTFCLLLSCLISLSTATMMSKTIYEVIYHGIAFIFYLAAALTLMIEVNHQRRDYRGDFEPYLAAAFVLFALLVDPNNMIYANQWWITVNSRVQFDPQVMGFVMAFLYLLSTFLANRSYRGI